MIRRIAITVAAFPLTFAACGSEPQSDGGGATTAILYYLDVLSPEQTTGFMRTVFDAEESVIADCMHGHGFEYVPLDARKYIVEAGFGPGVPQVARAEAEGLGVAVGEFSFDRPPENPNEPYENSLTERARVSYANALEGADNPDACVLVGRRAIEDEFLLSALWQKKIAALRTEVSTDPAVADVWSSWSSCVLERGYAARDYSDLVAGFSRRADPFFATGDLSSDRFLALQNEERQAARAAAECMSDHDRDILDEASQRHAVEFVESQGL